jgi:GNAT superfamily N-acetyltransferase
MLGGRGRELHQSVNYGMTESQYTVREPTIDDAEALARLSSQLGYPAEAASMPRRITRLADDPNAKAFVASSGQGVIGMITIHLRDTLNHATPIAQITLLVVDEAIRSRGAGRALVEAAEAWATARGAKRVAVTTALDRAGAHAFYERLGYAHTGRRYAKDFPDTATRG